MQRALTTFVRRAAVRNVFLFSRSCTNAVYKDSKAMFSSATTTIPVIDMSPLMKDPHGDNAKGTIKEIHEACRDVGFLYLTGHGMKESAMKEMLDRAWEFFALPVEKKMGFHMPENSPIQPWLGYVPLSSEWTAGYYCNREGLLIGSDACFGGSSGPSRFPDDKDVPGFSGMLIEYMTHMKLIGSTLMYALEKSLVLDEGIFVKKFNPPAVWQAFHHYYPTKNESDMWGVAAHVDYGMVTMLQQDSVGGLEVEVQEGTWIEAPPIPGTFIVNLGAALEAWTKGLYRATRHRVKSSNTHERISTPFSFGPTLDCVIEPLDSIFTKDLVYQSDDVTRIQMPYTYGAYILGKQEDNFNA